MQKVSKYCICKYHIYYGEVSLLQSLLLLFMEQHFQYLNTAIVNTAGMMNCTDEEYQNHPNMLSEYGPVPMYSGTMSEERLSES